MRYSGNTPDDIKTSTIAGMYPTITCPTAPTITCSNVVTKDTADKCEALDFPAFDANDVSKSAVEADDNCKGCAGTDSNLVCKASCSDTNGVDAGVTAADSTSCGSYDAKTGAGRCAGHPSGRHLI